jgi:deoxyribodipyrimidine photolyase
VWHGEQWRPGAASRLWQHDALAAFDASLQSKYGKHARISYLRGPSAPALAQLCERWKVGAVFCNRRHEPAMAAADDATAAELQAIDVQVRLTRALSVTRHEASEERAPACQVAHATGGGSLHECDN